jgi:outer membrane protein OmpA-like peptidoglycan-associated protein
MNKLLQNLVCVLIVSLSGAALAQNTQDEIRTLLFKNTEENLGKAKSTQADILSPTYFVRASRKYEEAQADFQKGKATPDIQRKLKEVDADLVRAMETAKLGKVTFSNALTARQNALKANAPQFASELYTLGQNSFTSAARSLEEGDVNDAKKRAAEAERHFSDAELTAIKGSTVGNVRSMIDKAAEQEVNKFAPATFARAQSLLKEAENILNTDRYNAGTAKQRAEQAEYEVRHALYLADQIKKLRQDERTWEKYLLGYERMVSEVATELSFEPQFDGGLEKPLQNIRQTIKSLREDQRSLVQEVNGMNEKLGNLNKELNAVREQQSGLQTQLEKERRKLEEKQQQEQKFKDIAALFVSSEARVIREGNEVLIRLVGLTFPSGKATIQPEFFALLTKLQRAVREFPAAAISIEGHTDSQGDDQYNDNLSNERANAVKQYMLANMNLSEDRVQAVGYGESRPIASNETEEGRAMNRRIDVVISPK